MSLECAFFGVLGRDADAKTSKAGKSYLRLNVRVGDGDQAQWVSVMSFDPNAIAVVDKLLKGSRLYIEGSLRLDEWTGQDGIKRHGLSVMSWHTRLSEIGRNRPKRASAKSSAPRSAGSGASSDDFHNDEIPF
jgi:single-strand DNA-binding protein